MIELEDQATESKITNQVSNSAPPLLASKSKSSDDCCSIAVIDCTRLKTESNPSEITIPSTNTVPAPLVPPLPPPTLPLLPSPPPLLLHPGLVSSSNKFKQPTEKTDKKGVVHEHILLTQQQQSRRAFQQFTKLHRLTDDQLKDYVFVSHYRPVKPVIQNGPLCGMVALAMASQILGYTNTTEDIFSKATELGLSLQGEMFSAFFMQQLAVGFLDHHRVEHIEFNASDGSNVENQNLLIKSLMENKLILFPYDADKNHGPCLSKGHKAHWALLTGFFAVYKISGKVELSTALNSLIKDEEVERLYYWDHSNFTSMSATSISLFVHSIEHMMVFLHQGKSRHCSIWEAFDMLDSNSNLVEVGPDKDSQEYIIPNGGIKDGLRCQAVIC